MLTVFEHSPGVSSAAIAPVEPAAALHCDGKKKPAPQVQVRACEIPFLQSFCVDPCDELDVSLDVQISCKFFVLSG